MSRLVGLLTGVAWAIRALIGFAEPAYYHPVTPLDWAAVWLFSVALLLLAPAVILLSRIPSARSTRTIGWVIAAGAVMAGVANALEDGFGYRAFGTVYVNGILAAGISIIALAVALRRARYSRLARLTLGLFIGFVLLSAGGGLLVLGVLGALALAPDRFDRPDPIEAADPV